MAVVPGFVPSEWDRACQRAFAFPKQQILLEGMIRRHISIPFFAEARRWMPVVLAYYARGKCMRQGWNVANNFLTIAAAEMAFPDSPDGKFLAPADARKEFVLSVLQSLVSMGFENVYSLGRERDLPDIGHGNVRNIVARCPQAVPADAETFVRALTDLPQDHVLDIGDFTADLAEAVALLASYLASRSTDRGRALRCNMYTLLYVSSAYCGFITEARLESICRMVSEETNLQCKVSREEVKKCRDVLTRYIDETNAKAVMEGLATEMDNWSLRLKLNVLQTIKSSMTCFYAIREAMRLFETFPWDQAIHYIPLDFSNYQVAVNIVNGNQYYEFKKCLGEAKHINYKSLSWLAIKLLIKNKEAEYRSLVSYRGIPSHPDREAELQRLIEDFIPPRAGETRTELDNFQTQMKQ